MEVTGYQLRETIGTWNLRLQTAQASFIDSLSKFEDEDKAHPHVLDIDIQKAEAAIAALQTAQSRYNLYVEVSVQDQTMTLCEAIKRIGGAGRRGKMWRESVTGNNERRYSLYGDDERDTAKEYKKPTMTSNQRMRKAQEAVKYAGALRAAIATGNGTDVELPIDPSLFE